MTILLVFLKRTVLQCLLNCWSRNMIRSISILFKMGITNRWWIYSVSIWWKVYSNYV